MSCNRERARSSVASIGPLTRRGEVITEGGRMSFADIGDVGSDRGVAASSPVTVILSGNKYQKKAQ